jgi:hypothetical protein
MTNPKPQIEVGESYAYTPGSLVQPLRAEVLEIQPYTLPSTGAALVHGERIRVLVHHPDGKSYEETLYPAELRGRWEDEASLTELIFEGDDVDEADQVRFAPKKTWAELAEESYAEVVSQRKLAKRLDALGIHRETASYAGRGGSSAAPMGVDARLTLTHDELDWLITMAERGPSYEGH